MFETIVKIVAIVLVLLLIWRNVKIVSQADAYVIEQFGKYRKTWYAGLHCKIPFVNKISKIVSMKEQVAEFMPQPVITKDNVTMRIDTVVYFQIVNPQSYTYGVEIPLLALENLTATSQRNIIGDMELDETLTSREIINTKMRINLEQATQAWGIQINRVELKNILPPAAIQDAMEKQMKAERERREAIIIAEGEKKSTILVAEGKKQSAILEAEAKQQSTLLWAEAQKKATILKAEASKEASIREAEGHAEAIRMIQEANADGIEMLNHKKPEAEVLHLKGLEAFAKAADGRATKIIIPSEIQKLAGLVTSLKEVGIAETPKDAQQDGGKV